MSRPFKPLLLLFPLMFSLTAPAEDAVLTVNGKTVPKTQVEMTVKNLARQNPQMGAAELDKFARDELIARELLKQEAERRGLAASAEFKERLEMARSDLLVVALELDELKKNPIKDEEARAEYDRYKAAAGGNEFHLRHILVDQEEDALAIIDKLNKGAKFADLVKQSKDQGSAAQGGDLGWVSGASIFGDAPSKLQKGKYSATPVKTHFGYHVLKLEETRVAKIQSFEEMKPRFMQGLQRKRLVDLQQELRKTAKVQ